MICFSILLYFGSDAKSTKWNIPFTGSTAQHDSILYDAGITYLFRRDWALDVQDELGIRPFQIGPNPTADLLYIQWKEGQIKDVRIWDIQGKAYAIPPSHQTANTLTLDLHSLTPGMYFLQTTLQNGQQDIHKIQKR